MRSLAVVTGLALLLAAVAAYPRESGPPGCPCPVVCECPVCECPVCDCLQPVQIVGHLPKEPVNPGVWHPDILDAGRETAVAAKKFGVVCDRITAVCDGTLLHACAATAWSTGSAAFLVGVALTMLFLGAASRLKPASKA